MSSSKMTPATTYPILIGRVLMQLRKDHGTDQAALAAAVGVTQSTWSRIERGESALSIEQLALAADKLNVAPSQISKWADDAAQQFKAQGGEVRPTRAANALDSGLVLIGAAAIGALIAAILSKK